MLHAYLVSFVLLTWHYSPADVYRLREISAIAKDVASTDANVLEALTLMNIAAFESGFERLAVAKDGSGSLGPFQVMPPARSFGAKEALSRLRRQGIFGYMGCPRRTPECAAMASNRTLPAAMFAEAYPYPGNSGEPSTLALR